MQYYTIGELLSVVLARNLIDGEKGEMGAYSEIPMAACRLAQLTHAPNLTVYYSATGFLNPKGPLRHSSTDYRTIRGVEAADSVFNYFYVRGIPPYLDFFFTGGLQIDKYGNVNLFGIGEVRRLKVRGPGFAGHPTASSCSSNIYIYMLEHSKRTLVEKVDVISAAGFLNGPGSREKAGLLPGGPRLVITPLAVMDFEPESKLMRLKSVNPGVTVEQVIQNTGFKLVIPPEVPETVPPAEEELKVLRTQVDPNGILKEI